MSKVLLSGLHALRLELETLKLHGHRMIDENEDWLQRLKQSAEQKDKPAPIVSNNEPERETVTPSSLEEIAQQVSACRKCALSESRTNTVFGTGSAKARLMFVGEAPGADEDRQGEPFVGRAGKLLTKMIDAMGLSRESVYIANILKCRPPENRNPLPDEVVLCEPYLKQQIKLIAPEVIVALGAVSAQTLLKTKEPISRLRGEFHPYEGADLLPTYHPAYLLRNPSAKGEAWKDLKMALDKLGLTAPEKQ